MKKFFGLKKKKQPRKERLSPPDVAPLDGFHPTSPMFQYARTEFAQTVPCGTSNDDGKGVLFLSPVETPSKLFTSAPPRRGLAQRSPENKIWMSPMLEQPGGNYQDGKRTANNAQTSNHFGDEMDSMEADQPQPQQPIFDSSGSIVTAKSSSIVEGKSEQDSQSAASSSRQRHVVIRQSSSSHLPQYASQLSSPGYRPPSYLPKEHVNNSHTQIADGSKSVQNKNIDPDYIAACSASNLGRQESLFSQASTQYPTNNSTHISDQNNQGDHFKSQYLDYPETLGKIEATYEEEYGDAYIGGPIRYVYPSGYQSMRPRSGPWKLSIVICLLFTWLSVFIVGHCSDRVDSDVSQYNQNEIDDDTLAIETRWCGSRLLYMMWVISMLVTGLAGAYCSIIGYIKVRDFAVANSRSQPPGSGEKTDFYAQVDDATQAPPINEAGSQGSFASSYHQNHYHAPIYQADGNPQFWGGHIYRPTQAAVAITSR